MDDKTHALLKWIVESSSSNNSKTAASPHGHTTLAASYALALNDLATQGFVQTMQDATGGYAVRPTDAGVEFSSKPFASIKPQTQHITSNIQVESGIPVPPAKRAFGPRELGPSKVDTYPFATMQINDMFFVPGDPATQAEKPMHRAFANIVSQANAKLYPKAFVVREWERDGVRGAGVWRIEDLTEPRPTRKRKSKKDAPGTIDMSDQHQFDAPSSQAPAIAAAPAWGAGQAGFSPPAFGSTPFAPPAAAQPSPFAGPAEAHTELPDVTEEMGAGWGAPPPGQGFG